MKTLTRLLLGTCLSTALGAGWLPFALAAPNTAAAAPNTVPAGAETLFGLHPGMDLDDARAALRRVGSSHSDPLNNPVNNPDAPTKDAAPGARQEAREEAEEGHTELWTLHGTPYKQVVLKSDPADQVVWITAILRPDQPLAFTRFGSAPTALVFRDTLAVWNVITPRQTPYRLIVRGDHGNAHVLSLIALTSAKRP